MVVPLGGGNCAVSHRKGWGHSLKKGFLGGIWLYASDFCHIEVHLSLWVGGGGWGRWPEGLAGLKALLPLVQLMLGLDD